MGLLLVGFYTPAYAIPITCPATIFVREEITQTPDGWQKSSAGQRGHLFDYMAFGDIRSKHVSETKDLPLREDDDKTESNISTQIWKVDGSNTTNTHDGYAIFCRYNSTDMLIVKPLPEGLKTCVVHSKIDKWKKYHFLDAQCN